MRIGIFSTVGGCVRLLVIIFLVILFANLCVMIAGRG